MIEHFLNFVISPGREAYRLSREPAGIKSVIIPAVALLSASAGISLLEGVSGEKAVFFLTWALAARIILVLFFMLVISAGYHFFAEIYGGKGSSGKLYTGLLYTFSPFCFVAPAALILKVFLPSAAVFLMAVFIVFLIFRIFYGQYNIINYFYGLKGKTAAAVLILPWAITGFVILIVPAFLIIGLGVMFL
ncbi:MAG: YIP1 family protein [Elusimicrobiota bacterium]|nr:YIP1 family protein [Elusimicrobiota bacterium]